MEAADIVRNAAKRFPHRPCVIEGDRALSFAEVDERAGRLVTALQSGGVRRGDRVALLAQNELEYLEIQVAAMRAGVILVPLNFRLAAPELAFIVGDCGPRLLIHGPGYAEAAAALEVPTTWHLGARGSGQSYDEMLESSPTTEPPLLDCADAATILYTSGTTGRPKGAIISNGALWSRVTMFGLEIGMRPGDTFVQGLPMFHIAANTAYSFTYRGASIVMVKGFDARLMVRVLERLRATHVLLVPTMINLLCHEPTLPRARLDHLRMVLYGASPIPPDVLRRAIELLRCDFLQFFGMTETAGCSLLRPADHDPVGHPERLSSAGTDALSFETRVVDEQDRDLPAGAVGEIICRGPSVMDGYWNAPAATSAALRGGWMHTGDLGYRCADGYLYVSDRLKDMIVSGGENVYPREVEDVLYSHPAVLEAAVIGIPHRRWGEAVHALVVLRAGAHAQTDELIAHCRGALAAYKIPKSVELVAALPKSATGKILKRQLREPYWHGPARRVD